MDFETEIPERELPLNYGVCWKLPPESLFHNDPKITLCTMSLDKLHIYHNMAITFNFIETSCAQ